MADPEQRDDSVRAECVQRVLSALCETDALGDMDIGARLELAERIGNSLFDYLIGIRAAYDGMIVDAVVEALSRRGVREQPFVEWQRDSLHDTPFRTWSSGMPMISEKTPPRLRGNSI